MGNGVAMMVRQFRRGNFAISNLRIGVIFSVGAIFSPQDVVPVDISQDNLPGHLFSQDNSMYENFPRRFPSIGWNLFTYDDIYLISPYAKGYVRYGMFL